MIKNGQQHFGPWVEKSFWTQSTIKKYPVQCDDKRNQLNIIKNPMQWSAMDDWIQKEYGAHVHLCKRT